LFDQDDSKKEHIQIIILRCTLETLLIINLLIR